MKAWLHAFLTLALDGEGVVSLTRRPLHPMGKIYRYPLNRRLSGSQNRPGRFGKEIASVGIRTLGRPPCSLVTILTELFRLHQSSITHGINCVHWLLQKLQIVIYIMYCVCVFVCWSCAFVCVQVMWTYICVTPCSCNTDIYLTLGDRHFLLLHCVFRHFASGLLMSVYSRTSEFVRLGYRVYIYIYIYMCVCVCVCVCVYKHKNWNYKDSKINYDKYTLGYLENILFLLFSSVFCWVI